MPVEEAAKVEQIKAEKELGLQKLAAKERVKNEFGDRLSEEKVNGKVNRRSAVALGLAAASAAIVKPAAAQTTDYKDTTPWPGVVVRAYGGETPSIIPGFKTVSMRDIIIQPGSKTANPPMMNAMVCHITEGELRLEQDGKTFTAKKNYVWTCNKGTKENAFNDGNVVAIMRITDLKA